LNDLIADIYEAGLKPDLWPAIMPRKSGLFGGAGIAFGVVNVQRGLSLFPEHNFSPACMNGVAERYHLPGNNPGIKLAVSTAPMTLAPLEALVSTSDLLRTDFTTILCGRISSGTDCVRTSSGTVTIWWRCRRFALRPPARMKALRRRNWHCCCRTFIAR
jgi:hypothetical protein